jgi:hypothetical protein
MERKGNFEYWKKLKMKSRIKKEYNIKYEMKNGIEDS